MAVSTLLSLLCSSFLAMAVQPEVQRPAGMTNAPAEPEDAPAPAKTVEDDGAAPSSDPSNDDAAAESEPSGAPEEPLAAEPQERESDELEDFASDVDPSEGVVSAQEASRDEGPVFRVSQGSGAEGPPFYDEADTQALRERYELEPTPPPPRAPAKWRCLIGDPTCGISFELSSTSAYAYRVKQGNVGNPGDTSRWNSGRIQYDFALHFPILTEDEGRARYTRIHFGPKGGVVFSDGGDLWGNLGVAFRYWFGRGRWAPTLEFTSALAYKIGSRIGPGRDDEFRMTRGPVGFAADVGVGLGGFGAIVLGGQYDSPLAREDVPEQYRTSAGGMFFVGFRGNILWGGPAAASILTHTLTERLVER